MFMRSIKDRVLDASVAWSFDQTGFERHAKAFQPREIAGDLAGKTVLVTGGNSGIGLATARLLLPLHARVKLLCRDVGRGEAAWAQLQKEFPDAQGGVVQVDVSSLQSIQACAVALAGTPIHALVHCAGSAPEHRETSVDGMELQWATHVVGPLAVTQHLLPQLHGGRVIFVSSGGMYTARLRPQDPEFLTSPYDKLAVYAHHKRVQLCLARRWQEEIPASQVAFHAMHPGWVDTPLLAKEMPAFHAALSGRLRTPAQGADTVAWLVANPALAGTPYAFWFDRMRAAEHVFPWTVPSQHAVETLWERARSQAGMAGVREGA